MTNAKEFEWQKNDIQTSLCPFCIHKHTGTGKCDAFILGIPDRFLDGSDQHTSKTKGDNGIIFEENPKMKAPKGLIKS